MKKIRLTAAAVLLHFAAPLAALTPTPSPDCSICQGGLFCDSFEYPSNSITAGQWTVRSGTTGMSFLTVTASSGLTVAQLDPAGGFNWAIHNSFSALGDQDFEATVLQGSEVSLMLRATALTGGNTTPDNCYIFDIDLTAAPAKVLIYKIASGFWFPAYNLSSGTASVANSTNFRMRFKAVGTQLTAYIDGAQVLTASDSTFATGTVGMGSYVAPAQFDDLLLNKGLACPAPSYTATRTASPTPTFSGSPTPSVTCTPSNTFTNSPTPTLSSTPANCLICRGGIFCDDFESSGNSVASALWTTESGVGGASLSVVTEVSGNRAAQLNPNGGFFWATHNSYGSLANQDFEALVTAGSQMGLILRSSIGGGTYVTPDNCYLFFCDTTTYPASVKIQKIINASWSPAYDLAVGFAYVADPSHFHLRFSAIGSLLKAYVENALVLSVSDNDLTSGRPGILAYGGPCDFDEMLLNPVCAGPTPTFTPTMTYTLTPVPTATAAFARSGFGDLVLGPVPALAGSQVCLYFGRQPSSSAWEIYNVAGEHVASLSFSGSLNHCWDTKGMAPGIYLARVSANWAAGGSASATRKIILVK